MNMSPAVPGKEQAKGRGSRLGTGALAVAAVLYVMLSGCTKPAGDLKSLAVGPMAKLVVFPGIGHAPTLMHEDQISVVRDFLLK